MAFNQVTATSLTPSRPAPAAPVRRGNDIGNALSSSGYASSFSVGASSPSGSSYTGSYSGIGGSPNRGSDTYSNSNVVRSGIVSVKEDGIVSWLWRPKWLVLKEQTLSIHKNEVSLIPNVSWGARSLRSFSVSILSIFLVSPLVSTLRAGCGRQPQTLGEIETSAGWGDATSRLASAMREALDRAIDALRPSDS